MNSTNQYVSPFTGKVIYKSFSVVLIVIMVITLLPHYGKLINSNIEVSWSIILHGVLYLGWYLLFAVQSHIAATGNANLHKRLGKLSIILVLALVASGTDLLVGVMVSFDPEWSPEYLRSRTSFVLAILHTLLSFFGFYVLGVIFRARLHLHKRFMLLASLSMISASITRVAFLPFIHVDGMVLTLLTTYALLLCPVIIDRLAFGKVHTIFKWAVPGYIVTQILFIGIIPNSEIGQVLAFPFKS